jgi:hypothetical protein
MVESCNRWNWIGNGFPLSREPQRSGASHGPAPAARRAVGAISGQGYLWLKHLLPAGVLAFRRRYFEALSQLIAPGTDPVGRHRLRPRPAELQSSWSRRRWAAYEVILPAAGHLAIL